MHALAMAVPPNEKGERKIWRQSSEWLQEPANVKYHTGVFTHFFINRSVTHGWRIEVCIPSVCVCVWEEWAECSVLALTALATITIHRRPLHSIHPSVLPQGADILWSIVMDPMNLTRALSHNKNNATESRQKSFYIVRQVLFWVSECLTCWL